MKMKSYSEVAQSCPTLSNPMDFSPPGFSIHGIFQTPAYSLTSPGLKIESQCIGLNLRGQIDHTKDWHPWQSQDRPGNGPDILQALFSVPKTDLLKPISQMKKLRLAEFGKVFSFSQFLNDSWK